jgi:hypothetical protein
MRRDKRRSPRLSRSRNSTIRRGPGSGSGRVRFATERTAAALSPRPAGPTGSRAGRGRPRTLLGLASGSGSLRRLARSAPGNTAPRAPVNRALLLSAGCGDPPESRHP